MTREPGEDDDDETPAVDLVALKRAEEELARRTEQTEEDTKR